MVEEVLYSTGSSIAYETKNDLSVHSESSILELFTQPTLREKQFDLVSSSERDESEEDVWEG